MKNNSKKNKKNILLAIIIVLTRIYLKIVYRYKVIGKENIPKEGPIIFCGNHRSFLDAPLIIVTSRTNMRFLAKKELTKNKFLSFIGKVANVIYVDKESKDMSAVKTTLKTLKEKDNIAIFPEGTRNGLEKGEKVKDGVAFFALNSEATIIPVGIKGGEKLFKKVVITYGKSVEVKKYRENKKDKDSLDKVTNVIMKNIIELSK